MWPNPQEAADLFPFAKVNLNRKLHLWCSVIEDQQVAKSMSFNTFKIDIPLT